MKILGFKCDVVNVKYVQIDNPSRFNKEEEPTLYICMASVREVGQGLAKVKSYVNVKFLLTQEEFENRAIEPKDRLEILDNATWRQEKSIQYKTYDPEKIKTYDTSLLKKDSTGKTYAEFRLYPYSLRCKQGSWKTLYKYYEKNYCTIENSRVHLPLETREQFEIENKLYWFLENDEMAKVRSLDGQQVRVFAYESGNKVNEKIMSVQAQYDATNNTNCLILSRIQ